MSLQPVDPMPPEAPTAAVDSEPGAATDVEGDATPEEFVGDPEASGWIELEVLDENDRPVPGESFELRLADGRRLRGTTDAKGIARVESIPSGEYELTLSRRDRDAWQLD